MTDQNVQIVQGALDAFARGDTKALLGALADDIELVNPGEAAGLPWAGRYKGKAQVERFLDLTAGAVDYEAFEPQAFVASGDKVVVLVRERWRAKRTGKVCHHEYAIAFTVRGGRITHGRSYEDTALEAAALR